jgi:hypothetical protein
MGGSCAQAEKPEIQEPGRPEGLPRTAAITQRADIKKRRKRGQGAGAPASYSGSQARSLNWQRLMEGSWRWGRAQSWRDDGWSGLGDFMDEQ